MARATERNECRHLNRVHLGMNIDYSKNLEVGMIILAGNLGSNHPVGENNGNCKMKVFPGSIGPLWLRTYGKEGLKINHWI